MCYSCDIFSRGLTLLQSTVAFHKLIAPAELIISYWCLVYGQLVLKFNKLRGVKNPMTPKPGYSASAGASPLLLSHLQMAVLCLPCDLRRYLWLAACGRPYYCKC